MRIGKYDLTPKDGPDKVPILVEFDAKDSETGRLCTGFSAKVDNLFFDSKFSSVMSWIQVHGNISHRYIQDFIDIVVGNGYLLVVLEQESNTLLSKFGYGRTLFSNEIRVIFRRIANAVAYLHSINVCHLDIRAENVILDANSFAKLGGFYRARKFGPGDICFGSYGSIEYQAPEVFSGAGYDPKKADVWALGVLFYGLLTNRLLFDGETVDDVELSITNFNSVFPKYFDHDVIELLSMMLEKDPEKRASIDEIVKKEWVNRKEDFVKGVVKVSPTLYTIRTDTSIEKLDSIINTFYGERATSIKTLPDGSTSVQLKNFETGRIRVSRRTLMDESTLIEARAAEDLSGDVASQFLADLNYALEA